MWTCPDCRHQFVNIHQSHSCGVYTVEDFLHGKPPACIALFHHFIDTYRTIGPLTLHPVKTRVALMTSMRFCAVNQIGKNHITGHLVLVNPYKNASCFFKIDNLNDRFFVHHFKLYQPADINSELLHYMKEAYDVGNRHHIKRRTTNNKH